MIPGLACAAKRPIVNPDYVLATRPFRMPELYDDSPYFCAECYKINNQKMWKITERDFLRIKEKLIEMDDYIEYLLELLES